MKMRLTQDEVFTCLQAAMAITSKKGDLQLSKNHYNKTSFLIYLADLADSIGAEWIVAKYFDKPFKPFDPERNKVRADVGDNLEVKHTKYEGGQLIVYEYDRPTDIAILVTGTAPVYDLSGWVPVSVAQKPRYRSSNQPTWWVPQINLQPIQSLRLVPDAN